MPRDSVECLAGPLNVCKLLLDLNPGVALYYRFLAHRKNNPPLVSVECIVSEATLDPVYGCDYLLVRTGLETADWVRAMELAIEKLIRSCLEQFTQNQKLSDSYGKALVIRGEAHLSPLWRRMLTRFIFEGLDHL